MPLIFQSRVWRSGLKIPVKVPKTPMKPELWPLHFRLGLVYQEGFGNGPLGRELFARVRVRIPGVFCLFSRLLSFLLFSSSSAHQPYSKA